MSRMVVWDLDGTLVHTAGDVARSVNAALASIGVAPVSESTVITGIGPGIEVLFGEILGQPPEKVPGLVRAFEDHYAQTSVTQSMTFSGIDGVLAELNKLDVIQVVLTNKYQAQSEIILDQLHILNFFQKVVGPDTYGIAKPDPRGLCHLMEHFDVSATDTVMVGDSEIDILTAQSAKVPIIAAAYGYRTIHQLRAYNPDFIAESPSAVFAKISSWYATGSIPCDIDYDDRLKS